MPLCFFFSFFLFFSHTLIAYSNLVLLGHVQHQKLKATADSVNRSASRENVGLIVLIVHTPPSLHLDMRDRSL